VDVFWLKDLTPKIGFTPLDEVPRLLFEHRVLICDRDKLVVTESLCVRNVGEVWVPLLAEFTDNQRLVKVVLLQECLGIVVAVNVDLGQSIVHGGVLGASLDSGLQPWQDQFKPIPLLDFVNQLVDGEVSGDRSQETLDRSFVAIHIQQATNNLRGPDRVDLLDVNFDELGQTVLVQIENQVVHKVEPIADNDKRKLVLKFGLLEEVLDFLRVVVVALSADALDLADLVRASCRLDVLEMDLRVLAKVDDRSKIIVETWEPVNLRVTGLAWLPTFEALKGFEHLYQLDGAENIRVLGGDLDDNLEVLAHVHP